MGLTHLLISGTATSLVLGTARPDLILVGAVAGLGPDVDISDSPAGRVFPWVANYLERRFPHRSCTHSLMASAALAVISYSLVVLGHIPREFAHAVSIGYFAGYFADCFTKAGIELFWPSPVRAVCPGNRQLRLQTGSPIEYIVVILLLALAILIFNINFHGGMLTQFNHLLASPTGVEQLYNQEGSNHLLVAHIEGVHHRDRSPVKGDFWIIDTKGKDFIVQSTTGGEIYQAGIEPDAQLLVERITADLDRGATTTIEPVRLQEQQVLDGLMPFHRATAMVFVSGELTIDDAESVQLPSDPYQFPTIRVTGNSVALESAPLMTVNSTLGEQFATGQLLLKSIYAQQKTTPSLNPQPE